MTKCLEFRRTLMCHIDDAAVQQRHQNKHDGSKRTELDGCKHKRHLEFICSESKTREGGGLDGEQEARPSPPRPTCEPVSVLTTCESTTAGTGDARPV